jgi:NAD(P)-dependent dehydrogenase (short-subunit alcohol dehydrogenase family)
MSQKIILITGASSGFGAMTARTLADTEHIVYAGMRDIDRNATAAAEAIAYAGEHRVALRPIEMDVSE